MSILSIDLSLFHLLNNFAGQSAFWDAIFVFCAEYLIYIMGAFVFVSFIFWKRAWQEKIKIALIFGIFSIVLYGIVFFVFHPLWPRERPFEAMFGVVQLIPESGFSFPSKHALFSFFIATFVFGFSKKVGVWFLVMAFLISLGRVFVGVHYPLDVLVGAVSGIMVGWVGIVVSRKLKV